MDHRKVYNNLVESRKGRVRDKEVFYEKHHIQPRSFGGSNKKDNLVYLTLKEHYIAHLLLVGIYPESPAMHTALWNMCNVTPKNNVGYGRYKPSSRMYDRIRTDYMQMCSGVNAAHYNKRHTKETKKLLSEKAIARQVKPMLGKKHTPETIKKIYNTKVKNGTLACTETQKKHLSESLWGGKCYKAKQIVCTESGNTFGSGRELSEYLNIPFSTIRRWLNGHGCMPDWFHYKRVSEDRRKVKPNNRYKDCIFVEELEGCLSKGMDKRDIVKKFNISKNHLTKLTEMYYPQYIKKRK